MVLSSGKTSISHSGFALVAVLLGASACGSSEPDAQSPADASPAAAEATEDASDVEEAAEPGDGEDQGDADEAAAEECDTSTIVYTPFTDAIPADWPEAFPQPQELEEISGDVGVGCGRVSVDMRGRYYGAGREWVATYGDELEAAGLEFDDEYDELGQLTRKYSKGQSFINYGGDIELEGRDGEYIGVGITLIDYDG